MTRKVYLVNHDFPPTSGDLSAAEAAGAAEVICGIPNALRALGISTYGYHEIAGPTPPRRLIPKSVVQERVNAEGKLADVFAILNADPISFARWFAPDWPNVYFDDPGLLAILAAVGADIDAVTAPA